MGEVECGAGWRGRWTATATTAMSCRQGQPPQVPGTRARILDAPHHTTPLYPYNGSRRRRVFSVGRFVSTRPHCYHSAADLCRQTCPRSQTPRPPPPPPRHPLPRPRVRASRSTRPPPLSPPPQPPPPPLPPPPVSPPTVAPAGASMASSRPSSRPSTTRWARWEVPRRRPGLR